MEQILILTHIQFPLQEAEIILLFLRKKLKTQRHFAVCI